MKHTNSIQQVAVLGAGMMGTQIAAQFANNGFQPLLFDLSAKGNNPNAIAVESIRGLNKISPPALVAVDVAKAIIPANYNDDLELLRGCDLIIEAIADRLEWKRDLYIKIAPYLAAKTILVTNTAGLSINDLAKTVPVELKPRFLGMHFFYPPRQMHLVELIPQHETSEKIMDVVEEFATTYLGKGVVRAKDTPSFIGNRVGAFSILSTMHHAKKYDLPVDLADALTGVLIGRSTLATYRAVDQMGLDAFSYTVNTLYKNLPVDPWNFIYQIPAWILKLVEKGALGDKVNAGIYKNTGGESTVINFAVTEYRKINNKVPGELLKILQGKKFCQSFDELCVSRLPEARFLLACYRDLFHYCAYHLEHIAHDARNVDFAFRWGFGWEAGPFELWRSIGWNKVAKWLTQSIAVNETMVNEPLPGWVAKVQEQQELKDVTKTRYNALPVYSKQYFPDLLLNEKIDEGKTIFVQHGVRLWTLDNSNAILSFSSDNGAIDGNVILGIQEAIARAVGDYNSLILWQRHGDDFSVGISSYDLSAVINSGNIAAIEPLLIARQQVSILLRTCRIPTLAVVKGFVLGAGWELAAHCDLIIAATESYLGLQETKFGLIPSGGGVKECAKYAAEKLSGCDLLPTLSPLFNLILSSSVTQSAVDAKNKGLLRKQDKVVANYHEALFVAHKYAQALAVGYLPTKITDKFVVAGKSGIAMLHAQLVNMREGGFISVHDYTVAKELASVICGGEIETGSMVDEQWLLNLERDAFIKLLGMKATQEKILNAGGGLYCSRNAHTNW